MQQQKLNPFEQALKTYLDKRAQDDPSFAPTYAKAHKNIHDCAQYCMQQARNQADGGNSVCIEDATVYGWAVHYYDEDNIKISKVQGTAHAPQVQPTKIELTEEEKAEARRIALEREIEMQRKQLHKKAKPSQIKENAPVQQSLFDLL